MGPNTWVKLTAYHNQHMCEGDARVGRVRDWGAESEREEREREGEEWRSVPRVFNAHVGIIAEEKIPKAIDLHCVDTRAAAVRYNAPAVDPGLDFVREVIGAARELPADGNCTMCAMASG